MKVDTLAVCSKCKRHDRIGFGPQNVGSLGIDRQNVVGLFIPRILLFNAVPLLVHTGVLGPIFVAVHFFAVIFQHKKHTVRDYYLSCQGAAAVGLDHLARRRIERPDRLIEPQRNIYSVAHRHQPTRQLAVPALVGNEMIEPRPYRLLPKDRSVESVPRNQLEIRLELDRSYRALVKYVEYPSSRRYQRTHARHPVMMTRPPGAAHPLHTSGRAHHRIISHRIIVRPMQIMRPFIDFFGARFYGLCPFAVGFDVRCAVWRENAEDLGFCYPTGIFGDEQVDEIVGVGKPAAPQQVDTDRTIEPARSDIFARGVHVGPAGVQPMHKIAVRRTQRGSQSPVTTAQMDDQPAFDPGSIKDIVGRPARNNSTDTNHYNDKNREQPHDFSLLLLNQPSANLLPRKTYYMTAFRRQVNPPVRRDHAVPDGYALQLVLGQLTAV